MGAEGRVVVFLEERREEANFRLALRGFFR